MGKNKKQTRGGMDCLPRLFISALITSQLIYFKVAGCNRLLGFPKQMDVMQKNVR